MYRRLLGLILVVGGALSFVYGLILGSSSIVSRGEDCGSVFAPAGNSGLTFDLDTDVARLLCGSRLSDQSESTWTWIIIGVVVLVIGLVLLVLHRSAVGQMQSKDQPGGVAAELGRLATLNQQGALSDEEYVVAKRRILGDRPTAPK